MENIQSISLEMETEVNKVTDVSGQSESAGASGPWPRPSQFYQLHEEPPLTIWTSSCLLLLQRDTVISFGNQSVALSDTPLIAHRCDYMFEVDGDAVLEKPVACYSLCQV